MDLLKDINEYRKVALVMVTHSKAHADYATRQVYISDGVVCDKAD